MMIVMVGVACVVAEACMRLVVLGIIGNSVANAIAWRSIKCRIDSALRFGYDGLSWFRSHASDYRL